jgi:hypothetical protein
VNWQSRAPRVRTTQKALPRYSPGRAKSIGLKNKKPWQGGWEFLRQGKSPLVARSRRARHGAQSVQDDNAATLAALDTAVHLQMRPDPLARTEASVEDIPEPPTQVRGGS